MKKNLYKDIFDEKATSERDLTGQNMSVHDKRMRFEVDSSRATEFKLFLFS